MIILKDSSLFGSAPKYAVLGLLGLALGACASQPRSSVTISQSERLKMSSVEYAQYLATKTPQELLELKADPGKRLDMAMNLHSTSDLTAQAIAEGLENDSVVAGTLVELRRRVLTTALMERVGAAVLPPDEATLDVLARERYERDKKKFVTPERRHIAHVLLTDLNGCPCKVKPLTERVSEIWKQLADGGDMVAIAREHSQDKGTARKGGDLGWVMRNNQLVQSFEDAAFALKSVGDVSPPVLTDYGIHLIKLLGIEAPKQRSYEEVEVELKAKLAFEQRFGVLQTRRGLAYPDPDGVNDAEILKLVQQRIDTLVATGGLAPRVPESGKEMLEVPVGASPLSEVPPKAEPAATPAPIMEAPPK